MSAAFGVVQERTHDADNDTDVDLMDVAAFQVCFTGDGMTPAPPGCNVFDSDCDDDVDDSDYAAFDGQFTGP